jgi:hypothetical protein
MGKLLKDGLWFMDKGQITPDSQQHVSIEDSIILKTLEPYLNNTKTDFDLEVIAKEVSAQKLSTFKLANPELSDEELATKSLTKPEEIFMFLHENAGYMCLGTGPNENAGEKNFTKEQIDARKARMKQALVEQGLPHVLIKGKYMGMEEDSFFIPFISREIGLTNTLQSSVVKKVEKIASNENQDSLLICKDGEACYLYTSGFKKGKVITGKMAVVYPGEKQLPDDCFSLFINADKAGITGFTCALEFNRIYSSVEELANKNASDMLAYYHDYALEWPLPSYETQGSQDKKSVLILRGPDGYNTLAKEVKKQFAAAGEDAAIIGTDGFIAQMNHEVKRANAMVELSSLRSMRTRLMKKDQNVEKVASLKTELDKLEKADASVAKIIGLQNQIIELKAEDQSEENTQKLVALQAELDTLQTEQANNVKVLTMTSLQKQIKHLSDSLKAKAETAKSNMPELQSALIGLETTHATIAEVAAKKKEIVSTMVALNEKANLSEMRKSKVKLARLVSREKDVAAIVELTDKIAALQADGTANQNDITALQDSMTKSIDTLKQNAADANARKAAYFKVVGELLAGKSSEEDVAKATASHAVMQDLIDADTAYKGVVEFLQGAVDYKGVQGQPLRTQIASLHAAVNSNLNVEQMAEIQAELRRGDADNILELKTYLAKLVDKDANVAKIVNLQKQIADIKEEFASTSSLSERMQTFTNLESAIENFQSDIDTNENVRKLDDIQSQIENIQKAWDIDANAEIKEEQYYWAGAGWPEILHEVIKRMHATYDMELAKPGNRALIIADMGIDLNFVKYYADPAVKNGHEVMIDVENHFVYNESKFVEALCEKYGTFMGRHVRNQKNPIGGKILADSLEFAGKTFTQHKDLPAKDIVTKLVEFMKLIKEKVSTLLVSKQEAAALTSGQTGALFPRAPEAATILSQQATQQNQPSSIAPSGF